MPRKTKNAMPPKSNHIPSHSPRPTQPPTIISNRLGTLVIEEDVWGPYSVVGRLNDKCLVIVVKPMSAYRGIGDLFLIGIDHINDRLRFVCDIPKKADNNGNNLYDLVKYITYTPKPNPGHQSFSNWILTENIIHDFFDAIVQKFGK